MEKILLQHRKLSLHDIAHPENIEQNQAKYRCLRFPSTSTLRYHRKPPYQLPHHLTTVELLECLSIKFYGYIIVKSFEVILFKT